MNQHGTRLALRPADDPPAKAPWALAVTLHRNADPIDVAFLRAAKDRKLGDPAAKTISFEPFSAKTRRTEAVVEVGGHTMRVVKGALRTVAEAAGLDAAMIAALEARADQEAHKGVRALAVARADGDGPLRLCGLALLCDAPRPDSRRLIDELRSLGIKVQMLTGDALPVAREIARVLGLGEITRAPELRAMQNTAARVDDPAGGGFAEVFPEDKFLVVKSLQAAGHIVGMTGDGVNDAPALRQAEVGIAVSGATDVGGRQRGADDRRARQHRRSGEDRALDYQRVLTWIVNKISRTILKAGFVTIAFLVTGKFVISALVMLLLVCLTDVTHIALATDRVQPSQKPETWNIGPLVRVAAVLGVLTLIEALGLLAIGWRRFGLFGDPGLRRRRALAVSACPKRVHLRLRHNLFARPERSRQVVSLRPCPPRSAPTAGRSEKKKGPPRLVGAAAMSNKTGSSTAKGIEA